MTLDEIAATLPNGFHDAELQTVAIDYPTSEARLILDLWIGDMGGTEAERESYRLAEVTLSGLAFWISEPPDARYPYSDIGAHRIDIGSVDTLKSKRPAELPPAPIGTFTNWIYVTDWNAFIYFAAKRASLEWRGAATLRH